MWEQNRSGPRETSSLRFCPTWLHPERPLLLGLTVIVETGDKAVTPQGQEGANPCWDASTPGPLVWHFWEGTWRNPMGTGTSCQTVFLDLCRETCLDYSSFPRHWVLEKEGAPGCGGLPEGGCPASLVGI